MLDASKEMFKFAINMFLVIWSKVATVSCIKSMERTSMIIKSSLRRRYGVIKVILNRH